MTTRRALLAALPAAAAVRAADWPEFRGPGGEGHSDETGLPESWSEAEGIVWKTAVPGVGWSSCAIADGRIWVTAAVNQGRSLRLISLDAASGKITLDAEVFSHDRTPGIHAKNSHASPTPIVRPDGIYVHFGSLGTGKFDRAGKALWTTRLDYNYVHGPGGSPVIFRDVLIVNCDGADRQFVTALDLNTGEPRWRTARRTAMAFATPLVIRAAGRDQVVSPSAHRAISYDPATGKELWFVRYGDGFSNVPRPVFAHGLVYVVTGFYQPAVLAIRPDGSGDVTDTKVVWKHGQSAPLTPSPIVVGDEFYMISDNGIASCLDARTGKQHWRERVGGNHSASPVFAGGRIWFLSEEGEATAIAPGTTFRKLGTNTLDGRFLASIAPSGGAMYLRSDSHIYKVQRNGKKNASLSQPRGVLIGGSFRRYTSPFQPFPVRSGSDA